MSMHKSAKKSKDKSASSSSRNEDIIWNYDNLLWDSERQQYYWEGRKNGKRVRKYKKDDDFQGGDGSQDTSIPRGGTHGMGDMGVDDDYATPQDYRSLGGNIGGITQGMGNMGLGDNYGSQDTSIPRGGNIGDIPQNMGDIGVDDNYATPEYILGAPGSIPQNTHPDDLSPSTTFPQTSGRVAPTSTTLGTDSINPNIPAPNDPYTDYSTPNDPYAGSNEHPPDQTSHPQHRRRASDADQYQHSQFDDSSMSGKHHHSGKKDRGQRKGKGGAGGDHYPDDPFYGSNEGFDPNQPSYPQGQPQPDYGQSQTGGDDDYQAPRESRRDKGKGRAAEHDSHSKHHRSRGHGGAAPPEGSYGSGSGADIHQEQPGSYYGGPDYSQNMYGSAGGLGSGGTLEPIAEDGSTRDPSSGGVDPSTWDQPLADDDYDDDPDDPDFKAARELSSAEYYGNQPGHFNEGGPSQQRAYAPPEDLYTEYEGDTTPFQHGSGPSGSGSWVHGTPGDKERLDPRFRVENSNKFAPGEVFKVLWYEPKGSFSAAPPPPGGGSKLSDIVTLQHHRNNYFVGFRRFIVVANDEGNCTCVPILTYDKQGCNKKGVKPKKHGIIYEEGTKPKLLKNEPELGFRPVRMRVHAKGEKISRESRVNYSKLVTIEHNVKVFFVGRIPHPDLETVQEAVDICWENKSHGRRKERN